MREEKAKRLLKLPLLEGVSPPALIPAVIQAAVLPEGRQRIPGRPLVTGRTDVLPGTGTEVRAARSPSVRVAEPLSSARFPDARGASRTETARIKLDDLCPLVVPCTCVKMQVAERALVGY